MRKAFVIAAIGLFAATPVLADEPISVTGCIAEGVEPACIVLRTAAGKEYNVSAARPRPRPGAFGRVTGVLQTDVMTSCMQGSVIGRASWTQLGKSCPRQGTR